MSETTAVAPFTLKLPMTARSVPIARRALQLAMHDWQLDDTATTDVLLVAGELSANVVRHARMPGRMWQLVAARSADAVRIEVTDPDGDRMPVIREGRLDAGSGRGLHLVALLTGGAWGVLERVVGKTVWAEIACPGPGAGGLAS
jgi:anti-sigma regulatory factor (Ser/Thr protein kinase)